MSSVIANVEDTILAAVQSGLPGLLRDTGSLPGSWSIDLLKLLLQRAPAVYVAFNGGDLESSTLTLLNARFDVYAVVKEPTDFTRRRGTATTIGAYEIIEAVMPLLNGLTITDCGSLRGKAITNLFSNVLTDLGGTVYAMQLLLPRLPIAAAIDATALAKFEILSIDSSLTVPGADDFSTLINLPQEGA